MLRAGVIDDIRPSFLTIAGYLLVSLGLYFIFAPVYWYFFLSNIKRHSEGQRRTVTGWPPTALVKFPARHATSG